MATRKKIEDSKEVLFKLTAAVELDGGKIITWTLDNLNKKIVYFIDAEFLHVTWDTADGRRITNSFALKHINYITAEYSLTGVIPKVVAPGAN